MSSEKDSIRPDHQLLVLTDPTGHKLACKIFETYCIGEEAKRKGRDKAAYKRMPEFCLALDRLVSEFGGQPIPEDEPMQRQDADGNEDQGYDDDQDIHESATLKDIKMAVAKFLA